MTRPNKRALITGGTRGIGLAVAEALARRGYDLALNYLGDRAAADEAIACCRKLGADAVAIQADVSRADEVAKLADLTIGRWGGLDLLVNNAGRNIDRPLLEMTEAEWVSVVDVVLKGTFLVSKAFVPALMESRGVIINISANTALTGRRNGVNYCPAKAGVLNMTKCLARELGPAVRVNSVVPGLTLTEETAERFDLPCRTSAEIASRRIPLDRLGSPADTAAAVCFLASDAAAYITGQMLVVDGGEYMT